MGEQVSLPQLAVFPDRKGLGTVIDQIDTGIDIRIVDQGGQYGAIGMNQATPAPLGKPLKVVNLENNQINIYENFLHCQFKGVCL